MANDTEDDTYELVADVVTQVGQGTRASRWPSPGPCRTRGDPASRARHRPFPSGLGIASDRRVREADDGVGDDRAEHDGVVVSDPGQA